MGLQSIPPLSFIVNFWRCILYVFNGNKELELELEHMGLTKINMRSLLILKLQFYELITHLKEMRVVYFFMTCRLTGTLVRNWSIHCADLFKDNAQYSSILFKILTLCQLQGTRCLSFGCVCARCGTDVQSLRHVNKTLFTSNSVS